METTRATFKKALVGLLVPVFVALGYLTSVSQGIPPQSPCGTLPGVEHQCSTALGGCNTHRICEEKGSLGVMWQTDCCYYDARAGCIRVRGGWECCPLDPPSWKAICKADPPDVNRVCRGTRCEIP